MRPGAGGRAFQEDFFARSPDARSAFELFEYLPSAFLYVKNHESRFVWVNRNMLTIYGLGCDDELLGRSDTDYHPPALAEAYIAEDRRVMAQRRAIPNQVWLVPHVRGAPRWFVSSKTPLFGSDGGVLGIAGVMYPIDVPADQRVHFRELRPVIQHIEEHFADAVSMREMAARAGLSPSQFNRRFRELLKMTPTRFLHTLRIQEAQRLLSTSSGSLAEVSMQAGFYDQSHFTRRFRSVTGMTPREYVRRFRDQPLAARRRLAPECR